MKRRSPLSKGRGVAKRRGDLFSSLQREIDQVFQHFGHDIELPAWDESGEPSVDVAETDHDVQVTAELPGVDENDIDVTLSDKTLTIKAEKRAEKEEEGKQYHMVERSYGSFTRNIILPCDVDQEAVDAKFEKGVLSVMLPKSAEARRKTKTIKIES